MCRPFRPFYINQQKLSSYIFLHYYGQNHISHQYRDRCHRPYYNFFRHLLENFETLIFIHHIRLPDY